MGKETGSDDLHAAKANARQRPRHARSSVPTTAAAKGSSTSLKASATSTASTILPHLDSQTQDILPPPGQASASLLSASTTTAASGVRRLDTAKHRTTRRSGDHKVKSSWTDDGTTLVDPNHDHHHDDSTDASLFTPGAFSVSGNDSVEFSNNNKDMEYKREYQDPDPDPSVALLVAAEVVTENDDDDKGKGRIDEEDLELKIAKAVESRLMQRDQSLVVAEVVPPPTDPMKGEDTVVYNASCAQCCSDCCMKWKYPIILLLLGLCGAVVAIALSEGSSVELVVTSSPSSSPGIEFRQNELKQIVQEGADMTPFEDPNSPQSLALDWLIKDSISMSPDNFIPPPMVSARYALAVLYYSTNGNLWKNRLGFLTDRPTCEWNDGSQIPLPTSGSAIPVLPSTFGVHCDGDDNVKQVRLSQNGLDGTLPSELSSLWDLQVLGLDQNALDGSFPPEMTRLTDMRMLYLDTNSITGTIPPEMGLWFSLESFHANDNRLQGTLPTEFGQLSYLRELYVYNNFLTGTIPLEFTNNSNVEVIFDPQQVP